MKKIFLLAISAMIAICSQAITVKEAYDQIAGIQGAQTMDIPAGQAKEAGLDFIKLAAFEAPSIDTMTKVATTLAGISDEKVLETSEEGAIINGFKGKVNDDRYQALMIVNVPGQAIMVLYAQGGEDVMDKLQNE